MSEVATDQSSTETESQPDNGYMGDAFNDYLESGVESEEKQPEETKTEGNNPEEKPVEQPQPNNEGETKENKDVFQLAFENANGELDYEKIMSTSFGDDSKFQQLEDKPNDQQPALSPEQEIEQETKFRESITSARLGPLDKFAELVNGGMDVNTAFETVYNDTKAMNDSYFKERDNSQFNLRREKELAAIKDEARQARLTEISRSNALSIVNTLPGSNQESKIALYNHIMFSDDAGGALLEDMFVNAYPDYSKMKPEELDKAKKAFINKLQSDPARLKRHFDRSYRLLAASPANLKRFAQSVSRNKESQVRSNALAAQKAPQGAVSRPPQAQSNSVWDGYMNGIPSKTRV
jgi:hypothetical protein